MRSFQPSPEDNFSRASGSIKPFHLPSTSVRESAQESIDSDGLPTAKFPLPKLMVPAVKQALTKRQISVLIRHARTAYDIAVRAGITDLRFDEWRHIQVASACGCDGLTKAKNKHFRAILSHFELLAGNSDGINVAMHTGSAGGYAGETIEDREQAIWLIRDHLSRHKISENYAVAIARNNYKCHSLDSLNAAQAMALLFTLRRRSQTHRK